MISLIMIINIMWSGADYYAPTHLAETREGVYESYSQADADRIAIECKDLWVEAK